MSKSGVYIITNTINEKVYVGSTVDIVARWNRHCSPTTSTCTKLANAMKKHGVDKFSWRWLEVVECNNSAAEFKHLLLAREQHYIDTIKPFDGMGYNLATKAGSNLGITFKRRTPKPYKHTQNYLDKVSGENSKMNKPVDQYDQSGSYIQTFFNLTSAAEGSRATVQAIVRCCQGKDKTANGYRWCYADESLMPLLPHKSNQVVQSTTEGTVIAIFQNARIAAETIGKSVNPIYKCCRGEQTEAHGFCWSVD